MCVAYAPASKSQFKQTFFEWPRMKNSQEAFIDQISHGNNVWFCVSLLSTTQRRKDFALPGSLVWADLDGVDYENIEPPPSCVVQSSPEHYHCYWRLDRNVVPQAQEEYSRKLAYKIGADKSGWDIVQLLRVPYTYNYKPQYQQQGEEPPMIEIIRANEELVPLHVIDELYVPDEIYQNEVTATQPMPDPLNLPSAEKVIYRYLSSTSSPDFIALYQIEPGLGDDWSKKIWRFINLCLEIGMSIEETFVVAQSAKCNKYERDNRPLSHLWKDVLKASVNQQQIAVISETKTITLSMPELVEDKEITNSFVNQYKEWAIERTDAPEVYHELSSVILLSAVLSPHVQLETIYGEMVPNLWGLILGKSTLTRKTTSMDMAMNILRELDGDAILASEASPEGLLAGLSLRPNQVSVFFRDEIAGFFGSIKDNTYMSVMPELLTKLYDVPETYPRLLKRQQYNIVKPYFVFFGGGIVDKVYSLIDEKYISSGFIPRFLIVSGETDADHRRRTGPPVPGNYEKRKKIVERLANVKDRYNIVSAIKTPSGAVQTMATKITAHLTEQAWERFGEFEYQLEYKAQESNIPESALTAFTRLKDSMLKVSVLFAAERSKPNEQNKITVQEEDIVEAATCIQKWGEFTVDLLLNSGKGDLEVQSDRVFKSIRDKPGINRSELFYRHHLRAKSGDEIIETLSARGLIYQGSAKKPITYYPTVEAT